MKQAHNLPSVNNFLEEKSVHTMALFHHFIITFRGIAKVTLQPTKSMIAVTSDTRKIAYITQLGKNFIHVVIPFKQPYTNNLCFQKIAQVPGDAKQFNHHLRLLSIEDVNEEVIEFMRMSVEQAG